MKRLFYVTVCTVLCCLACSTDEQITPPLATNRGPSEGTQDAIPKETIDFLESLDLQLVAAEASTITYPGHSRKGHPIGLPPTDLYRRHSPESPSCFDVTSTLHFWFGSGAYGEFGFYNRVSLEVHLIRLAKLQLSINF